MKTYYEILDVDCTADQGTIRKSYLKKSLQYHPDKNPDNPEEAKAKFVEIGAAYETLRDPIKRRLYDQELQQQRGRRKTPTHQQSGQYSSSSSSSSSPPPFSTTYTPENFFCNTTESTYDARSYESYRDVFDETVAGMSEAELAAAIGTIAAVAGVVGGIVGKRLMSGGGGNNAAAAGRSVGGGSNFLSEVGSAIGSMVASEIAASSVRAIHQESTQRLVYREECRQAVARGMPMPDPPQSNNKWGQVLEKAISTVLNVTQQSQHQPGGNNTSNQQQQQQQSFGSGGETSSSISGGGNPLFEKIWKEVAAGVKSATRPNSRTTAHRN